MTKLCSVCWRFVEIILLNFDDDCEHDLELNFDFCFDDDDDVLFFVDVFLDCGIGETLDILSCDPLLSLSSDEAIIFVLFCIYISSLLNECKSLWKIENIQQNTFAEYFKPLQEYSKNY